MSENMYETPILYLCGTCVEPFKLLGESVECWTGGGQYVVG